jgi:aspartate/glutamate racemase
MKNNFIGILAWDGASNDTLSQLELMPGNMLNPATFNFPLRIARVKGADYKTIVENPDPKVLVNMIATAKKLVAAGAKAITTSCGFNAFFQKELAAALTVPVFASSLIQIPLVHSSLKPEQAVGVITAEKCHLTQAHFKNTGVSSDIPIFVAEVADVDEFAKLRNAPNASFNADLFIRQVADVAVKLVADNPGIGAIVLECTDLPPCAAAIRMRTALPVYDIVTLLNMVNETIIEFY